ncbi:hypothetical protein ACFO1B_04850 [Dactylosporangium siamense]|uniref:hypothetical protein n=1 Tax=Dactylosporangium siamense TaxID=685454 RepID=UPI0019451ADE|nr:hypothetical protein [Dactylosporangium siamense]
MRRRGALLVAGVVLAGAVLWSGIDRVLIRVYSGGGFAGTYDLVVIWASGRALIGDREVIWSRLTPGQLRRLRAALGAADFPHSPHHRGGVNFGHRIDYGRWSVIVNSSDVEGAPWLADVLEVPLEVNAAHRVR